MKSEQGDCRDIEFSFAILSGRRISARGLDLVIETWIHGAWKQTLQPKESVSITNHPFALILH